MEASKPLTGLVNAKDAVNYTVRTCSTSLLGGASSSYSCKAGESVSPGFLVFREIILPVATSVHLSINKM